MGEYSSVAPARPSVIDTQPSSSPEDTPRLGTPHTVEGKGYHCEALYVGKPSSPEMLLQVLQDDLCLLFHTSNPKTTIKGQGLTREKGTHPPSLPLQTSEINRVQQVE